MLPGSQNQHHPPQGLWAYASGTFYGLCFRSQDDKIDHVSWFRDLGLPDFGPGFDRILRGRMIWNPHADHYILSYYGQMVLPNQVYRKVTGYFQVGSAQIVEKPINDPWLG